MNGVSTQSLGDPLELLLPSHNRSMRLEIQCRKNMSKNKVVWSLISITTPKISFIFVLG